MNNLHRTNSNSPGQRGVSEDFYEEVIRLLRKYGFYLVYVGKQDTVSQTAASMITHAKKNDRIYKIGFTHPLLESALPSLQKAVETLAFKGIGDPSSDIDQISRLFTGLVGQHGGDFKYSVCENEDGSITLHPKERRRVERMLGHKL